MIVDDEEEKARKGSLASQEYKVKKILASRDDKVWVSRECQIKS